MNSEITIESFGLTKSPLDAYRGTGRHTRYVKLPKEPKLFSNITAIKPLTLDTKARSESFPNTLIIKIDD